MLPKKLGGGGELKHGCGFRLHLLLLNCPWQFWTPWFPPLESREPTTPIFTNFCSLLNSFGQDSEQFFAHFGQLPEAPALVESTVAEHARSATG